jgi:hypothetical protein
LILFFLYDIFILRDLLNSIGRVDRHDFAFTIIEEGRALAKNSVWAL